MRLEPAIPVANRDEMTEEEWLSLRRKGIGGSDVAGVLRLSKWKTPLSVWFDKVEGGENEQSIAAELGHVLEPYLHSKVVPWFAENDGVTVEFYNNCHVYQHPEYPFLMVNLDDAIHHPDKGSGVIEYKTASEWVREEWGEGELPDAYYAQVQFQMEVMGSEHAWVFALIGNRSIEVRYVPRNQDFIDRMVAECVAFWETFVLTAEPPGPTGQEMDEEILRLIYPGGDEDVLELDMEAQHERYKTLTQAAKDIEKEVDLLKQEFMAAMGNREIAMVGESKVTWKTSHRKGYTRVVEPKDIRTFRIW